MPRLWRKRERLCSGIGPYRLHPHHAAAPPPAGAAACAVGAMLLVPRPLHTQFGTRYLQSALVPEEPARAVFSLRPPPPVLLWE